MPERKPSYKQRLALQFIEDGVIDPSNIAEVCDVPGGFDNEATFIMRLIDRGWVDLVLTEAGHRILHTEEGPSEQ